MNLPLRINSTGIVLLLSTLCLPLISCGTVRDGDSSDAAAVIDSGGIDVLGGVAPQLTGLSASGNLNLAPDFSPEELVYTGSATVLGSEIRITPTALDPNAAIQIGGNLVVSGETSRPIPLDLGINQIPIRVMSSGGEATYQLEVTRSAGIDGQVVYGKASNTGPNDQFGTSIAMSGDLLAVGAIFEDSTGADMNDGSTDTGAVYVFRRNGLEWEQEAYIKASNPSASDVFGASVAIHGDTLVVGAFGEDSSSTTINMGEADGSAASSGAAYVYRRMGTTWTQEAYLKGFNTVGANNFGKSVAVFGDTIAVGAPNESSVATGVDGDQTNPVSGGENSGAVYVFRRTGSNWERDAYIKASNSGRNDNFGGSIALFEDRLAVGAISEDSSATGVNSNTNDANANGSGAVYVFHRTGGTWAQEAYVKASNTDAGDEFGFSVALTRDVLAVGATGESSSSTGIDGSQGNNGVVDSGAAYVFRRNGTDWIQAAYVKAPNPDIRDGFGFSVALSRDVLAVGARFEGSAVGNNPSDNSIEGEQSGAVYLFRREQMDWKTDDYVKPNTIGRGDVFGSSVALSGDSLAVGAPTEDSNAAGINGDESSQTASAAGAMYIFE